MTNARWLIIRRLVSTGTAAALVLGQLAPLPVAEASHLGSASASAGSAPPPSVAAIESFQPDLFSGRATTAVPIAVPPGRKGVQPSLGLAYSSSGRNGWLGVGWSLDTGYIERSTKHGVPAYDATDTYTFMFQGVASELVKIPGGTYRAKDEGLFLRFENNGASGWEITDKSGTRYFFGQNVTSQIESTGKVFRWCLDKVLDLNGNYLTLTYTKNQQQLYLAQIQYTGHESTPLAPANKVEFLLETRPDPETSFRSGFEVTTAKRLQAIETKATVNSTLSLARRYELTYDQSPLTNRSRLTAVTQVGTDRTTKLPPMSFTYTEDAPTYLQCSTCVPSVSSGDPLGLSGDFNGDGYTDLAHLDPASNHWHVLLNVRSEFEPEQTWLSTTLPAQTVPLVGDVDADGKADLILFNSSTGLWQVAYSTGNSFQAPRSWQTGFGGGETPFMGDFNGDQRLDIGTVAGGTWRVALSNDGNSGSPTTWLSGFGSGATPLTGDFNGDGLTDVAAASSGTISIALSNGTKLVEQPGAWQTGFGAGKAITSADVTGDGLTDLVYYEKSTGTVVFSASTGKTFGTTQTLLQGQPFTLRGADDRFQVGDFGGKGLSSFGVFSPTSGTTELALVQGTPPDLLDRLANGLGGESSLTYSASTDVDTAGGNLPFVLPLVTQVDVSDGMGHTLTTTYKYEGGAYDAATREFRGFHTVTVVDAVGTTTQTTFSQDLHTKGRPLSVELRDSEGRLYTKTTSTWSCDDPHPGVHFTKLDQTDGFVYDGDDSFRQVRSRFFYDAYGNVTKTIADGQVNPPLAGDERTSTINFTYNTDAWILSTPSSAQTRDAGGAIVAQRRFYYDGATTTTSSPTVGLLTKEEEWLNLPDEQWLATSLTYDPYGYVASVTDALGRTTTNTYDATGTYLTQIENVLGHTRTIAYDPRFGHVTRSTDQNNQTTTTEYDVLGRVTKVIGPNDTAALPTLRYDYDACMTSGSCTAPIRSTVHTRLVSGGTKELTVYAFIDGLGRTIQTRSPAEDPLKQIVTGAVELDARGLVTKQWVPYLDAHSTSYASHTLVPGLAVPVSYTYDAISRLIQTVNPDGSNIATRYQDGVTITTDPAGHETWHTTDAYGRLSVVDEVLSDSEMATTTYAYDSLDNLVSVIDARGNRTIISYDSLARKIAIDDPDMGVWSYTYDPIDNLTSQTDARGVMTSFIYDALNRLTEKSYAIPLGSDIPNPGSVTYTYDDPLKSFSKGKLTKVEDGSGSSSFEYDNLGRLVTESKTIDNTTFTVHRTYDLLGRLTTLTYPDGDIVSYTYNDQGGIETIAGQTVYVSAVAYNAAGQLTQITYGNGVTTDYSYDPQTLRMDRLVSTGPIGPLQDFSYGFDAVGNVTQIDDAVQTGTQTFDYDALNRLTYATGSYGAHTYAYDPIGNMTSKEGVGMDYGENGVGPHAVTSTSDGQTMVYDANGNLIEKRPASCPVAPAPCPDAQFFSFDTENRLVDITTALEETVSVTFEPGWNFFSLPVIPEDPSITSLFQNFSVNFEQIARVSQAPGPGSPVPAFQHYVGDPEFDQFTELSYGVGYQVYCTNSAGVTIPISGRLPTNQPDVELTPGWHLLPAMSPTALTLTEAFSGIDATQVQAYDTDISSLTTATEVAGGQAYWIEVATASTWTPAPPEGVATRLVYDGDGGKVKRVTSSGTTTFLGEVYEKRSTGETTKYVFAGSLRIAAVETPPSLEASLAPPQPQSRLARLWHGLVDALAFWQTPSVEAATPPVIRFYHGDHLGSSNVVTDGTGKMVELAEHSPFGALSRREGTEDVSHKFTGQRQDTTNGLILFPARAYDPALGRFLQPDPFVQDPSDPQTLNRYAYVRNNPVNLVDPSGYGFWSSFFRVVAIVAAVVAVVAIAAVVATGALASTAIGTSFLGETLLAVAPAIAVGSAAVSAGSFAASASDQETPTSRSPPAPQGYSPPVQPLIAPFSVPVSEGGGSVRGGRGQSTQGLGESVFTVGVGGILGGGLAPFMLPSGFIGSGANIGLTSSLKPVVQVQYSLLGGWGAFGGVGGQAGILHSLEPLPQGMWHVSDSLQVQMHMGAKAAVGGSMEISPQSASVTGGLPRVGYGLGLMFGGGKATTSTYTFPPLPETFNRITNAVRRLFTLN